jgi:branched-chain amino acid transport system permease protein
MHELLSFTIIGLVTGAAYAVAASGLVVTYSTSGIFNIAHGAIGMLMAFVYWQLAVAWHWPKALALALVVLVLAPAFGALVEMTLIRKVRSNSLAVTLVVTVGLMVGLIGAVELIWKPQARNAPSFFGHSGFNLFGVVVTWHQGITVGVGIAIAVFLRIFLYRTRVGIAMRAVVDNRDLAALNGARPALVGTLSWALGSSLAALAGILIAPQLQLSALNLSLLVINAYAAAMVGRLRNLPLTFAGALGLGLIQSYAVGYLPTGGLWGTPTLQGLRLSIPVIMLAVVLLILPQDSIERGRLSLRRTTAPVASLQRSIFGGIMLVAIVAIGSGLLSSANLIRMGIGLATGLVMLSLVPLTGWAGQVSLCQMTFAGLGAFAMSKMGHGGSVLGLFAAVALAGAVGTLIALPALRLRGLYLALATMAFAVAMDNMFFPAPAVLGFDGSVAIARPSLFGLHLTGQRAYLTFLAVVFAVLSIGLLALRRGPIGRVLSAMKDSEAACATLGLSLTATKLFVFTLSAGLAGLAGALYGGMRTVAGATDFQMLQSLPILLLVVLYGVSTCSGALFGGLSLGAIFVVQSYVPSLSSLSLLGPGLAGLTLGSYPEGMMVGFTDWVRSTLGSFRGAAPLLEGATSGARTDSAALALGP